MDEMGKLIEKELLFERLAGMAARAFGPCRLSRWLMSRAIDARQKRKRLERDA